MAKATTSQSGQASGEEQSSVASVFFASLLFAADHPDLAVGNYASPCEQKLLEALANNDGTVEYPIRILRGDLLLRNLASRLIAIDVPIRDTEKKSYTYSRTEKVDTDSFATIIGDLCDSLEGGLTTANLVELVGLLGNTNIFCLTLNPLSLNAIKFLDRHLSQFPPYLGALTLDTGNPLHIELFSKKLLDCVWIEDGQINASRWDTNEGVYEFGLKTHPKFRVVEVPWYEFRQTAPPRPRLTTPTARGLVSAQRLRTATAPSHFEQVAGHIVSQAGKVSPKFPAELKIVLPAEDQMFIPVAKLTEYALNDQHVTGKHKAKLFSDLMCVGKQEWRFLAYQIRSQLECARLEKIEVSEFGIQYRAQMEVVGINGRVLTIETRWIIRPNEPAQLATVFVADKLKQREVAVDYPPWVEVAIKDDERWSAIYQLASNAGQLAATKCVPVPMKIEGFSVIMDGACGGAQIHLDGRLAFSRWLRKNNYASKEYRGGVAVSALVDGQSVDRAKAYCDAFARVLWLNGIDSTKVETYLS